jgi:hypothetical protein
MDDRRAGPGFFYVLGDPYSRFAMSKIGITQRLENRLLHIFSQSCRLPDGFAVFSLYSLPDWYQAAELERAVLRFFHNDKADSRTLAWIARKPGVIDLTIDEIAEHLGLECQQLDFSYVRWSHDDTKTRSALYQ